MELLTLRIALVLRDNSYSDKSSTATKLILFKARIMFIQVCCLWISCPDRLSKEDLSIDELSFDILSLDVMLLTVKLE